MTDFTTGVSALYIVLAFALAIAWLMLPFAVFGICKRLDRMSSQLEDIRSLLHGKGNNALLQEEATRIQHRDHSRRAESSTEGNSNRNAEQGGAG